MAFHVSHDYNFLLGLIEFCLCEKFFLKIFLVSDYNFFLKIAITHICER